MAYHINLSYVSKWFNVGVSARVDVYMIERREEETERRTRGLHKKAQSQNEIEILRVMYELQKKKEREKESENQYTINMHLRPIV